MLMQVPKYLYGGPSLWLLQGMVQECALHRFFLAWFLLLLLLLLFYFLASKLDHTLQIGSAENIFFIPSMPFTVSQIALRCCIRHMSTCLDALYMIK